MPSSLRKVKEENHRYSVAYRGRKNGDEKLVPEEEVRNAIVDVEVVKVKVDHIASSFDKHVSQNITDFKEVHSRLSKLRDEINEDIENTWKEVDRLNRWKWMFTKHPTDTHVWVMTLIKRTIIFRPIK